MIKRDKDSTNTDAKSDQPERSSKFVWQPGDLTIIEDDSKNTDRKEVNKEDRTTSTIGESI
jgi:hypothetical protein